VPWRLLRFRQLVLFGYVYKLVCRTVGYVVSIENHNARLSVDGIHRARPAEMTMSPEPRSEVPLMVLM
jgi:hypothetical protein